MREMFNIEAEEGLVGSLITDNSRLADVAAVVEAGDFYGHATRAIFVAMVQLKHCGMPFDLLTLDDHLRSTGEFDDFAYLAQIQKNTPSSANVMAYAQIVADRAETRRQLAMAQNLAEAIKAGDSQTIDELRDGLAKGAQSRKRPLFDLMRAVESSIDMIDTEAPPLDTVFREAMPMAEPAILTAAGGTGKSFTTLQMAISVATGKPVFDGAKSALHPTKIGKVLIIGGEDSVSDYHRRLRGILENASIDEGDKQNLRQNLIITSLVGEDARLIAEVKGSAVVTDVADRLLETLKTVTDLRLIVIDPMIRFYGAGENDNHTATMFINQINKICLGTGAAVLLVHHSAKSNVGSARGASAFVDGSRTHLAMMTFAQKKAATNAKDISVGDENKVLMEMRKANHVPYWGAPLMMQRGDGGVLRTMIPDDTDEREIRRAKAHDDMMSVLNFIRCNGRAKTSGIVAERKNISFNGGAPSRDVIVEHLAKLEASGQLVQDEAGYYDIPGRGNGDGGHSPF